MPIDGKLYSSQELQELLDVSKQRISNLASDRNWDGPQSGLYWAECVEWYLHSRGVDPQKLPIRTYDHPEGITRIELEKEFDAIRQTMEQDLDD